MNLCQWPSGCGRPKRPGRGSRYCAAHERVQAVREVRRKRAAAVKSRQAKQGRRSGHLGPSGGLEEGPDERRLWEDYRVVLREFGLK